MRRKKIEARLSEVEAWLSKKAERLTNADRERLAVDLAEARVVLEECAIAKERLRDRRAALEGAIGAVGKSLRKAKRGLGAESEAREATERSESRAERPEA